MGVIETGADRCDGRSAVSIPSRPRGHWLTGCACEARRVRLLDDLMLEAQEWRGLRSDMAEAEAMGWTDMAEVRREQLPIAEARLLAAILAVEEAQ